MINLRARFVVPFNKSAQKSGHIEMHHVTCGQWKCGNMTTHIYYKKKDTPKIIEYFQFNPCCLYCLTFKGQ